MLAIPPRPRELKRRGAPLPRPSRYSVRAAELLGQMRLLALDCRANRQHEERHEHGRGGARRRNRSPAPSPTIRHRADAASGGTARTPSPRPFRDALPPRFAALAEPGHRRPHMTLVTVGRARTNAPIAAMNPSRTIAREPRGQARHRRPDRIGGHTPSALNRCWIAAVTSATPTPPRHHAAS